MSEPIPVDKQLPESGVPVLAWFEAMRPHARSESTWIRAMYVTKHSYEETVIDMCDIDCDYDEATDAYYIPEGWYELVENWAEYAFFAIGDFYEVTHWLPLPAPPSEAMQ